MEDSKIVKYFSRHLVPISVTFERDGNKLVIFITSFVLSVRDQWILVTAGHWDDEIDRLLSEGYKIIRSYLIDSLGSDAKHLEPIPLDFNPGRIIRLAREPEFDYGVMPLSQYYRDLLENNGVKALDEEVWKKQPASCDFYKLLGIPSMLVTPDEDTGYSSVGITLIDLERVEQRPDGFPDTDIPLFYGRIELGKGIMDIRGMSGGPIFGFQISDDEQLRYWLIALQSTWLPSSRYVKACPTKILGDYLEYRSASHA